MTTTEGKPPVGWLRNSREFRSVYAGGHRRTSRSFVVFVLPAAAGGVRFGLTAPRKLGKAHERNRIRRRIREMLRHRTPATGVGADIVINPRRSVLDRNFRELEAELGSLLRAAL